MFPFFSRGLGTLILSSLKILSEAEVNKLPFLIIFKNNGLISRSSVYPWGSHFATVFLLFLNVDISGNQIPFLLGIITRQAPRVITMKPETGSEDGEGIVLMSYATQYPRAGMQPACLLFKSVCLEHALYKEQKPLCPQQHFTILSQFPLPPIAITTGSGTQAGVSLPGQLSL